MVEYQKNKSVRQCTESTIQIQGRQKIESEYMMTCMECITPIVK